MTGIEDRNSLSKQVYCPVSLPPDRPSGNLIFNLRSGKDFTAKAQREEKRPQSKEDRKGKEHRKNYQDTL
jgi:hypothetical protein